MLMEMFTIEFYHMTMRLGVIYHHALKSINCYSCIDTYNSYYCLTHCQTNENPFSNQEIHVQFEHGVELQNVLYEPPVICMTLYTESVVDQTDHFADVFVRNMLHMAMTL